MGINGDVIRWFIVTFNHPKNRFVKFDYSYDLLFQWQGDTGFRGMPGRPGHAAGRTVSRTVFSVLFTLQHAMQHSCHDLHYQGNHLDSCYRVLQEQPVREESLENLDQRWTYSLLRYYFSFHKCSILQSSVRIISPVIEHFIQSYSLERRNWKKFF